MTDKTIYEQRQEEKRLHEAYREYAKRCLLADKFPMALIKISDTAHVHAMSDGAFVEVQIWIDKSQLPT